jgi:hypothetical protein
MHRRQSLRVRREAAPKIGGTLVALVLASGLAGPLVASASAKGKAKGGGSGESLKLVVKPPKISLTDALHDEFFVEVSGHSSAHAKLEVFLQVVTGEACAANAPTEAEREEVQEQNPAQSIPGSNVEKYPTTFDTNFTGSFDWDTNTLLFTEGVKPGPKLICAYLSPPEDVVFEQPSAEEQRIAEEHETGAEPKRVLLKPLLTAHAKLSVVTGKIGGKKK